MPKWLENSVFYQVYPQSFCDSNGDGIGDIPGLISKLDYIKNLGCNAIWLNPVYDSPFMDAGYDVRDYFKIAPRYGTNDDAKRLFEEVHKRDMKILMDLVPGHTSDTNEWFTKSKQPLKNELSNRYIWTDSVWEAPPQYRLMCGITDRDGNYLVNYFSSQPALNYGFYEITHPNWQLPPNHPDCLRTVEALKKIMRFWLDMGCDGFRVDMADSLVKNDDEKIATSAIWAGIREMMDKDYPECALVSEWCSPKRAINKGGFHADFYLDHRGNGYSTAFRYYNYETGKQESFFSKEGNGDIMTLVDEFTENYEATKDSGYISFFTCNHDNPRMSAWYDELELKINFCTIFTLPGVPFLYYGDEIGMRYMSELTSKEGGFSRTGSRTPMQWTNGVNKGFSSATTDKLYLPVDTRKGAPTVESQEKDENSLYNTVKKIIAIRKANPELCGNGDFEVLYAEKSKYPFIFKRGSFVIAVNPKAEEVSVPFELDMKEKVFEIGSAEVSGGKITLSGQTYCLFKA